MRPGAELSAFAARIGHSFARPALLVEALTHPSLSSPGRRSNQRLEFLGDRVLGLVIAEALLAGDAGAAEGQLAPRLNALVRQETCAEVARAVGLGEVLKLGRSEAQSGGRRKEAILADAMEAVIAAVYLDAGYEAARAVVLGLWGERIARAEAAGRDPKTALQEWTQARGLGLPAYGVVRRHGADHAPRFTVEVRLADGSAATAEAGSRRVAEREAAAALLARLEGRAG
ncbi:MAG: ribonuclease III [Rhodobacteraceae bacterium]|nr:ribonuclease III [Paracoccaceae bacterium]